MNYQGIYSEFIADRKAKAKPEGYTESHHIVPRSLSGGDEASNLIALTADDHFFAHLLLAKIHGGKLWAAIALMIGGQRRDWKPVKSRREYAWAKREMAKNLSGENAYQFDWQEHKLIHDDGRIWSGRQSDMKEIGLSKSLGNMLIKGRIGSAKGWFIEGKRPVKIGQGGNPGLSHHMADHRQHHFKHINGRAFI